MGKKIRFVFAEAAVGSIPSGDRIRPGSVPAAAKRCCSGPIIGIVPREALEEAAVRRFGPRFPHQRITS
jgi:hypothetical protein